MLKIGDKGKEVNERRKRSHAYRELQEKLLGLGYELPKYANPNRRPEAYGKKQPTPVNAVVQPLSPLAYGS